MAAPMDRATIMDWEDALKKGELEPEDRIFWAEEREKYLDVIKPPEVQGPPPSPPTVWDRATSAMGRVGAGTTTVDPMGGSQPTIAPSTDPATGEAIKPGDVTDWERSTEEGARYGARLALEHAPDVLSMLHPATAPASIVAKVLKNAPWLIRAFGPAGVRAMQYYTAQQLATRAANAVDPTNYTDPNESAKWTAIGEGAGRALTKVPEWGLQKLKDAWKPTPYQLDIVKTVEDLGGGTTLGMGSEKAWPQWSDVGLTHSALGGRVRNVYDRSKRLVDEALDTIRGRHPSGKVDAAVENLTGAVKARAHASLLDDVPREVRDTTADVIEATNAKHVAGYQDIDTAYRSQMIHWRPSATQLPPITSEADLLIHPGLMPPGGLGPGSLFTETVQLTNALKNLPPAVTLDGLYEMYQTNHTLMQEALKHVSEAEQAAAASGGALSPLAQSIKLKVLDVLGTNQDLLNKHLAPYLVDRGPAQDVARTVVATWQESLQVPELAMQRGQAGRVGVLEDPQVMAARALLEKPRYGLFTDVHNDRQGFLKIGRMQGPNMGNEIAREANEVAIALDSSMERTGNRLAPKLTPAWRKTNAEYKADVEVLNSPLIQELAGKNLDDILTTLVANERPNDLKTLRAFLGKNSVGADVLDQGAEMWLTRKINSHIDDVTGVLDVRKLYDDLKALTKPSELALFPRGLTSLRRRVDQVIGIEDAVAEVYKGEKGSVFALRRLKNRVNDPGLWQEVQSDVLSKILHSSEGLPLDGEHILEQLGKTHQLNHVLFDPQHLQELTALAHTSRVLDKVAHSGQLAWSPMVRQIGHGVFLPAVAGGITQFATGDPTKAAMVAGGFLLGTAGLSYVLTQPTLVPMVRRLLATPANTRAYGELLGAFAGELQARNMSHLLEPIGPQGPPEARSQSPPAVPTSPELPPAVPEVPPPLRVPRQGSAGAPMP